jgi:subtilisin family serine protease
MDDNSPGRYRLWIAMVVLAVTISSGCSEKSQSGQPSPPITTENVIIQCASDCSGLMQQINELGGAVYKTYHYLPAIAATVPTNLVNRLETKATIKAIDKDMLVATPKPRHQINLKIVVASQQITAVNLNTSSIRNYFPFLPKDYNFNNNLIGATELHARDITGKNVVVAVIDTGTANNGKVVPALDGSVVGGENFVDLPDEPSATSTLNDSHGTWVASMIASHLGIVIPTDTPLVQSLQTHAPDSVLPYTDTESLIPMMGSSPESSIYAMKVFAAEGEGAPISLVIEAMDRVLTLKHNYNEGIPTTPVAGDGSEDDPYVYDSLNIQVVNLSLGGPTLFPGHALEDLLALSMLKEGITVVTAVGNEGFAAITGGSPGTSVGSLNVGALNTPQHERILRDLQFGPGAGLAWRPNSQVQVAYFSSRGPTADGRQGLQVVTNGFASFVQGAEGDISLISGTSFSSPTAAGAAALLWQAKPDTTANAIRTALSQSSELSTFDNYQSLVIDRGNGLLNLPAALAKLEDPDFDPPSPQLPAVGEEPSRVRRNIRPLGLDTINLEKGTYSTTITLAPGEVSHYFLESDLETDELTITVSNYQPGLTPDQQNQVFGDAFLLTLIDAPTSINDVLIDERIQNNAEFTVTKPQSGLLRLALMGDWTNAGTVSAQLQVTATQRDLPEEFAEGELRDNQSDIFEVRVNKDVTTLNFELSWEADWGQYPPHDIDLILYDPDGQPYFDGATLNIPERVSIDSPTKGQWTAVVTGFMLHGFQDEYELFVTDQDGNRLRQPRRQRRGRY